MGPPIVDRLGEFDDESTDVADPQRTAGPRHAAEQCERRGDAAADALSARDCAAGRTRRAAERLTVPTTDGKTLDGRRAQPGLRRSAIADGR